VIFFWLIALLAVGVAGWLNHRYMDQQLTLCKAALAQVEEQLEQADADSSEQITGLRRSLFNAQQAAASSKRQAEINAERLFQFLANNL
jgi:hypothetical protein